MNKQLYNNNHNMSINMNNNTKTNNSTYNVEYMNINNSNNTVIIDLDKSLNNNIVMIINDQETINKRKEYIMDILNGKYKISNILSYPLKLDETYGRTNAPSNILNVLSKSRQLTSGIGIYGIPFQMILNENDKKFVMKLIPYQKRINKDKYNEYMNPENIEIEIINALSLLVYNKITPHIILPIFSFISSDKRLTKYVDSLSNQDYDKTKVQGLLAEWADLGDLDGFMKTFYKMQKDEIETKLKVLLFQLTSMFYAIQTFYKGFRHNDCHAKNVLVKSTGNNKDKYYYYLYENRYYRIPDVGFQVMLWDFDFASLDGAIINKKVNSFKQSNQTSLNINDEVNDLFDIHLLMNTLYNDISTLLNKIDTSMSIPVFESFINSVIPRILRGPENIFVTSYRLRKNMERILKNCINDRINRTIIECKTIQPNEYSQLQLINQRKNNHETMRNLLLHPLFNIFIVNSETYMTDIKNKKVIEVYDLPYIESKMSNN